MRIASQKINNQGVEVSRTQVRQTTEKYVKQSGQACEKLYDMGYLPSPLYFNEDKFMSCLFDEYPEIMPLCRNITTGSISLSDQQMSYVMKALGESHKAYEVLSTARSAVQASQALSDISNFWTNVRFKKKDDILLCRSSLAVSNHVYTSGKIPLDGPYMMECFYVPFGYHIEEFNYSIEMLRAVLKDIGVDEGVCWDSPSPFLGDGFTVADDCEFLPLILRGDIAGSGKYADKLHKAVEFYYSDYYAHRTTIAECLKYEEQMFLNAINPSISLVNEFRREHPDYHEFFVDSQRVYWLAPGVVSVAKFADRDIYIGEDISNLGVTEVSLMNRLLGYSGQFLYRFDNEVSEYDIVGMPVVMYALNCGRRVAAEYYPAANLRRKFRTLSLPVIGTSEYSRNIKSVKEICSELDVETIDTLDAEVAELVTVQYKINPDGFKKLVGLLVQSLVCVMCDYTLPGRESPNHIHFGAEYGWVTDEIYADACASAETFFGKLGF